MKKLFISLLILAGSYVSVEACSNILVTRGASRTGSTMISYTADSHSLYGALYYFPAAKHQQGTMRLVREWDTGKILGEIPEATETYSVVGNMNEHQLLIGESTWGGRKELRDTTGIIDYGSLIYITLQRTKTAREAVEMMGWLVETYGYYSSGESISIADGNEVWYLEIIGKGMKMVQNRKTKKLENANKGAVWVAVRVPDGMISAHANQARITTFPLNDPENCLYSKDVISFARHMKYFSGEDKDFSFSDAYNPLDFGGMRFCEARVWSMFRRAVTDGSMEQYLDYAMGHNPQNRMPLWVAPTEKLSVKDVASLMRDHYEGTPLDMTVDAGAGQFGLPYRPSPLIWEYEGVKYANERPLSTRQTGWWYVGESRKWLPDVVGGVFWFGTDDTATSPLTPYYSSSTRIANSLLEGNGSITQYSPTSMFWIQNRVSNFAYTRYNDIFNDVKRTMDQWEDARYAEQSLIDSMAIQLLAKYPTSQGPARQYLTDYSVNTAQNLFQTWQDLDGYLLVKYLDFNIKREDAPCEFTDNGECYNIPKTPMFPDFTDRWKKAVVESNGDALRVVEFE